MRRFDMQRVISLLVVCGVLSLLVLVLALVRSRTTMTTTPAQEQECPVLIWSDEFDGTELDTNQWEYQIGDGCDIGLCGWGNHELQSYTKENAVVSNGTLKILVSDETAEHNNKKFTSSRIRTIGRASHFLHGRFEARIKLPTGQGVWPAFWMMPNKNVYGGWPKSGEIDIMENLGHEISTIHGTVHYSNRNGAHLYQTQSVNNDGIKFADGFHDFAIEKTPSKIRWLLDGSEYFVVDRESVAHWPFEKEFHFILNVAVGGDWPGDPDETTVFPQVMELDHVRVYGVQEGYSFGNLVGPKVVRANQTDVVYALDEGTIWNSFQWEVPEKVTIVKNLESSIVVDFGDVSGTIKVTAVSDKCNLTKHFSIGVTVASSSIELNLVDGADTIHETATLVSATGSYKVVSNPIKDAVNPSNHVIEYVRNSGVLYDSIIYTTLAISNPDDYVHGPRRIFSIDVLVTSSTNDKTSIILQRENNKNANPGNYPIGRHSRYQATVSTDNTDNWQHVSFLSWINQMPVKPKLIQLCSCFIPTASRVRPSILIIWHPVPS